MTVGIPGNLASSTRGGVGQSPRRPDGTRKVTGQFAYSSDLWHDDMLWGVTLRSPHPHARIRSIDIGAALATSGVYAVLTHEDVPGTKYYGLEENDQPVLAVDTIRYQGEAVALVAADHPETARRAMHKIVVDYEVLDPLTDPIRAAFDQQAPALHEHGNMVRHQPVRVGDVPSARSRADVVVTGEYEIGMQDQAFLGPESGLAVPGEDGGVELYVATQWMHTDLRQIAPCLGLPEEKVRMTLSGVGGAFGAREDLSMQVHAAMLAMHTGRPIKIVYNREESFYGHVHRHPAKMRYEHGATADGRIVYATARIVLDGGAYASSTTNVVGNAASLGVGPYIVPNVEIDAYGVYTNNPPCGAMRGFGAVQACYAYESQMDKLARALDLHPLEVRRINAIHQGAAIATGQVVDTPAPMSEMIDRLRDAPLPEAVESGDVRNLPGGVSNTTHGEGVRRGIGYGVGLKNICFSEGFDDYSTARVRLEVVGGEPAVLVHTAAAEVGQGLVTLQGQIARTELGVERVSIAPADTQVGDAGSSSASRQSYMTGGAVKRACEAVRERLFQLAAERFDVPAEQLSLSGGKLVSEYSGVLVALADLLADGAIEETREFHHRPTTGMDPVTGQGDTHTQLALCIHRAVVDVDVELGLLKVVDLTAVQDVGTVLNRVSLEGQIHGGTAQGLGLAVMEEIQLSDGKLVNPSFTDYLIPTILDMPPMRLDIMECADPNAPYGLRGAGEPSTLSSTPAIAAAIRDATGLPLDRVPVRPHDIVSPVAG